MIAPYYNEEGITIYNADCRDVLPQLEPVDLVCTDPPFAEATHIGARSGDYQRPVKAIDFASVDVSFIRSVFTACNPRRWLISSIDWRHAVELDALPPDGFKFVRLGAWIKRNPMPQLTGDRPAQGWEAIAFLHSAQAKMRWNGGGAPACYDFGTSRWGYFGPSLHPTEKPLPLISKLLSQFAEKGETVLDPFMGSGTTLVAAKALGLKAIGIEIERKYCDVAIERLRQRNLFAGLPAPELEVAA